MANTYELRQVVGKTKINGKVRRVGWDMDLLLMNGQQIATVNRVDGAGIGLLSGVHLTPSEAEELAAFMAKNRNGKRPAMIKSAVELPFEILDDEEPETELDDE